MWIGWSLRPDLCGKGIGQRFIRKCINELKRHYGKDIFLKVYSWNTCAINVYEKSGFIYYDEFRRIENGKSIKYVVMKLIS